MKRTLFLLFFAPILLLAQKNHTIDSLNIEFKRAKHDTTRCFFLKQLAEKTDESEQKKYLAQLKELANKNITLNKSNKPLADVYRKYLVYFFFKTGNLYMDESDYKNAMECFLNELKASEDAGDKTGVGKAMWRVGIVYKNQDNSKKAFEYLINRFLRDLEIKNG
jgi:tetratricopeptide (TPR) repeat protein